MNEGCSRRTLLNAALGSTLYFGGCGGGGGAGTSAESPAPPPPSVSVTQTAALLAGVNLAGLEFNPSALPGVLNQDFPAPDPAEIDYYHARGARSIRLPFLWERLQPILAGPLNASYAALLDKVVDQAFRLGMTVALDAHQYGRRQVNGQSYIIGETPTVTSAHFANLWQTIAQRYRDHPVIFNLVNEPHDQNSATLVAVQNEAIAAIRATGARQLVLASGNAWSGAHSWVSSGNGDAMRAIRDPANNFAFDVHQYFDSDSSGTSAACAAGSGARLNAFTAWARANGQRAFLGEFAGGTSSQCASEVLAALAHIRANRDVWTGWAWWGGGAWWPESYMSILRPASLANPVDRPQIALLNAFQ